jgi:integrase
MQMKRELEAGVTKLKVMPTLEGFADEVFLPFVKDSTLAPKSKKGYQFGVSLLKNTTRKVGAEVVPYKTTRLDQVCNSDVDTLPTPGGPSTTNCMRRTLSRMLSLAVEKKYLAAKPKINLVRERKRKMVYSPELEQKVLVTAPQPLADIMMVVFDAGMRPDEIVRLQWGHILWDKCLIFVDHGKTEEASRHVPLSDRVRDMLLGRLKRAKNQWVFASTRKNGAHIRYDSAPCKQFRELRKRLAIPKDLVLYSARHTFGTDLMESTGNIRLVQKTMGHASLTTTERYIHPDMLGLADRINRRNRARAERAQNPAPQNFGHGFGHGQVAIQ